MFPNGTLLPSFPVKNTIIPGTNLKWTSSNDWSSTLPVRSARGKDRIAVATRGFKFFPASLQPCKKHNEPNQPETVFSPWNTKKLNQPKMVVANWMWSHRVVWWVSNCPMLHSADIPVSYRAPMKPSGHWHWNAPITLIHVPPFWHGLLLLLAHSSMSEKKNTSRRFDIFRFSWFVTFCIIKSYLFCSIFLKRTALPRYPKQVSLLTNRFTGNVASVDVCISIWFPESH